MIANKHHDKKLGISKIFETEFLFIDAGQMKCGTSRAYHWRWRIRERHYCDVQGIEPDLEIKSPLELTSRNGSCLSGNALRPFSKLFRTSFFKCGNKTSSRAFFNWLRSTSKN